MTVVVPEARELLTSPRLSESFGERAPTAFTDAEIQALRGELSALLPTYQRFRPQLAWGLERGLVRYNRVEGLSVGAAATLPLDPVSSLDLEARFGTGDRVPNATTTLRHGPEDRQWSLAGYHRLEAMGDEGTRSPSPARWATSFSGSIAASTTAPRAPPWDTGAWVDRVRWSVDAFHERQRPVSRETGFFLLQSVRDDTVDLVLPARPSPSPAAAARSRGSRASIRPGSS